MKKILMKNNGSFFLRVGYLLIGSLFFPTFIASLLLLFNVSIAAFEYGLGILILLVSYFLIFYSSKNKKDFYLPLLCFFVITGLCILSSYYLYDNSWDGYAYHLPSVVKLKEGWNPIYEHFDDINIINIWSEHYPKFIWIYGALLYDVTGHIFSPTSFNLILSFATFFICFDILRKVRGNLVSFVASLAISFNTITIGQLFTMYNDGVLGVCIISIILIYYAYSKKIYSFDKIFNPVSIILIAYLSILANIKFTGALFALLLFVIYSLYLIRKKVLSFDKHLLFHTILVGIGVSIIAINTYIPNYINHKNVGYPIVGEDKIDIITGFTPIYAQGDGNLISFIKSFSVDPRFDEYTYQPFYIISERDIMCSSSSDCNKNGFGPFYQAIVIFTLVTIIWSSSIFIYKSIKKNNFVKEFKKFINKYQIELMSILIIFLFFFITPASFWSRYIPYMFVLPLLIIVFFERDYKKMGVVAFLSVSVLSLYVLSTCVLFGNHYDTLLKNTRKMKNEISELMYANEKTEELSLIHLDREYQLKDLVVDKLLQKKNIKYKYADDMNCKVISEYENIKIGIVDCDVSE